MTYRVVTTRRADRELADQYQWFCENAPTYADKWLDGFERAIEALSVNPEGYGFAPEDGRFVVRVRQMLYGRNRNHRDVFFIHGELVVVVAIRHAAQEPLTEID